jgi:hypothetical protein
MPSLRLVLTCGMAFTLAACGSPADTVSTPSVAAAPLGSAAPGGSLTPARAETIFIDATAAHLCAVQSRVYSDPKELNDAYATPPPYPQLNPAQVEAFNQRVTSDTSFATRLTEKIRTTCGTRATPSGK